MIFFVEETAPESSETFKADFAANFGTTAEQLDRYAAFRDLFKDDSKPVVEPLEPPEKDEETKINNTDVVSDTSKEDRYAALREIVEMEFKDNGEVVEMENIKNENKSEEDVLMQNETNIFKVNKELDERPKDDIIKYTSPLNIIQDAAKSPLSETLPVKSPGLPAVTEIIQKSAHPTSGSLSDVISGSSPEVDNTGSASEIVKKTTDAAGYTKKAHKEMSVHVARLFFR